MSRIINALRAGDLQKGLREVNRDLVQRTAIATGADSEPMKAGAKVLVDNWKRLVSVSGKGEPSAPGDPPHAQTRRLLRSIGTTVVEGIRRVGSGLFTARLNEFGYTAKDGTPVEPRPHGRVALELSAQQMTDITVSELQRRGLPS